MSALRQRLLTRDALPGTLLHLAVFVLLALMDSTRPEALSLLDYCAAGTTSLLTATYWVAHVNAFAATNVAMLLACLAPAFHSSPLRRKVGIALRQVIIMILTMAVACAIATLAHVWSPLQPAGYAIVMIGTYLIIMTGISAMNRDSITSHVGMI